jgi:hypothetical protein
VRVGLHSDALSTDVIGYAVELLCVLVFVRRLALKNKPGNTYKRKIQALSHNHYRRGKAINIIYSEGVSVA